MRREDSSGINDNAIKLEELTKTDIINLDSKNENIIMNIKRRRSHSCDIMYVNNWRETVV